MNMGTIPTFRSSQTYKKEIPRGFKISATFLCIRMALTLPLIVVCVCVCGQNLVGNFSHSFLIVNTPPPSPKLLNSEKCSTPRSIAAAPRNHSLNLLTTNFPII